MKIQTAVLALLLGVSLVACPASPPPPTLTNYAEIKATVNTPIAVTKTTITDGIAPITYQVDPASPLPMGITVDSSSGAVTIPSSVAATTGNNGKTFSVALTDANNVTTTKTVTLTVNPAPTLTLSPSNAVLMTAGKLGAESLTSSGSAGTLGLGYTYSLVNGTIVNGFASVGINATTGAVTIGNALADAANNAKSFKVRLTDTRGVAVEQTVTLTVTGSNLALSSSTYERPKP